jgi:hypothetical protein
MSDIIKIDMTRFNAKKAKFLDMLGIIIQNDAIVRVPYLHGDLRRSIYYTVTNDSVVIGTKNISYAAFVEFGTELMEATHGKHDPMNPVTSWAALRKRGGSRQTMPFLSPAVFQAKPKIPALIKAAFQ